MIYLRCHLSLLLLFGWFILSSQIERSVLSDGDVYKVEISESGIYKIDRAFLASHNITIPNGAYLHIYGQRGGVLPERIATPRTDDLIEFPLLENNITGGAFSNDSYILFYTEGADRWVVDSDRIEYEKNPYDKSNYVFIKIDNSPALKIPTVPSIIDPEFSSSEYDDIQRFEVDKANPLGIFPTIHGSGQEWYGDEFSNLREKEYSDQFDFNNRAVDEPIKVLTSFVSRSSQVTEYEFLLGNQKLVQSIGSVRTGDVEAIHARKAIIDDDIFISEEKPTIAINYPRVGDESKGWLDYIQLGFRRKLIFENEPIVFRNESSKEYSSFKFDIQGVANQNVQVWDISKLENQKSFDLQNGSFAYETDMQLKTFVVFDADDIGLTPGKVVKIDNQNLHGIVDADMVIIYEKTWASSALKLANHRQEHSKLNVQTIDVQQIYNEFSSGRQDPTAIRDFAKMIRDRSENFRYLLLFGDGSFDYRGLSADLPFQSFVPTYETRESLDPLAAFPSDDYFAQLDDDEGDNLRGDLDIAVGRLPARSLPEAKNLVNKLISYDLNINTLGDWRSKIAFLADDEDSNLHLNDADVIANKVLRKHPIFNQKKIYWDAYQQESTPGGNRYPAANAQLNNDIEEGLLVMNYLGHGGPKGWSQERVLNLDDITSWSNLNKMPLVITATCSFTGFDDPSLTTAGEASIHNPSGGAIALFTTVRSVYASQNFRLTSAVFDTIFTKVDGDYMTIGEVMQSAKNTRVNDVVNARKFFLIGDPAMRLAIPSYNVTTTLFNDKELTSTKDTIGALELVKVKAQIFDENGIANSSFNGVADITLFDKASKIKTLRNDLSSFEKDFEIQKNILFSGQVTVTSGEFEFEFIVPLDIDYEYGNARLSYYAVSDSRVDAIGYFDNFVIGGTAENAISDNEGPDIKILLDNDSFQSGDIINRDNPLVMVELADESGINVSNVSIGHEIVGILDEDTKTTQVLNQRYKGDIDNYKRGTLSYRLEDLAVGSHTLTIRAFDILNNPGSETIEFEVVEDLDGLLQNVSVVPNPFKNSTRFDITNEIGGPVSLTLNIYNINGQLIHQMTRAGITNDGLISNIQWNGEGSHGPVSGGIYLYEAILESLDGTKTLSSEMKKIIVLK